MLTHCRRGPKRRSREASSPDGARQGTGQQGSGCPDVADPPTNHADDQDGASSRHCREIC